MSYERFENDQYQSARQMLRHGTHREHLFSGPLMGPDDVEKALKKIDAEIFGENKSNTQQAEHHE